MDESRQRTLAMDGTVSPIPWGYWVIEGQFLAGAYPGSLDPQEHRSKVRVLLDVGIRTFINLTQPGERGRDGGSLLAYEPVLQELGDGAPEGPRCQRFAIRDQGIPSPDGMTAILHAIDDSLMAGRPVYVHCWGGVGRTGTVVGCWLMRHGLATRDTVLDTLARLRQSHRERRHRPSPENEEQCRFVRDWSAMT